MKNLIFLFLLFSQIAFAQKNDFKILNNNDEAIVFLPEKESSGVRLAAEDLVADIGKVLDKKASIVASSNQDTGKIIVQTKLSNEPYESYRLKTEGGNLYITGNGEQATIFGIYHFAEHFLGIDPMYFWSDKAPEKLKKFDWKVIDYESEKPTFKYRGWFINDEDLLTEWYENAGRRNIDYPYYTQVVSPEIIEKVCETALRMRFNLIIPASFIDIKNPAEAALVKVAARRGLYLSMHHIEPMGVSAFTYFNYWQEKTGEKPLFSYYSNRDKVEEVWKMYADEWMKYPNVIWQIGLRGIADRPMWLADPDTPQSDAERGDLISQAMRFQMDYIQKIDPRDQPPVTTTLWAEGSVLNQAGHLDIPAGVTVVFADNSPGWRWQADFFETERQPENSYGVYYHQQLWNSGPHLAQIVPPAQTHKVIGQAVEKGDTAYCIMNVSNIREFQLGIAASADMLWDYKDFSVKNFEKKWFEKYYGDNAPRVAEAYAAYFDSFELNESGRTLALMDGQTRGAGLGILNQMKKQIKDPAAYAAEQKRKQEASAEKSWGQTALRDMGAGFSDQSRELAAVRRQKSGFARAESLANKILPQLKTAEKAFFQTNFISHVKIMLGLETWLENVLLAQAAIGEEETRKAVGQLQEATRSLDMVEVGKNLNTQTDKWQHWYRGDKKMNIAAMRRNTEEVLQMLQ